MREKISDHFVEFEADNDLLIEGEKVVLRFTPNEEFELAIFILAGLPRQGFRAGDPPMREKASSKSQETRDLISNIIDQPGVVFSDIALALSLIQDQIELEKYERENGRKGAR